MIVLKNLAESFITSAIDASATQITIPADHAGKFPNLLAGDNFRCALVNPATEAVEFINVTARNNNVLTVSRGEEGTAALAFPVESRIHMRMTAKTWEEMAAECWMRPKNAAGDFVLPQYESADSFSITGDFTSFFTANRAVKTYPNKSVGFVESAAFVDGVTTVKVIEMTVPADLTHVEAGLDPDALAKRSLSNEELLGYMTPIPILEMEALEVDGGTLVSGTIKHPEAGKSYPASTEFHFSLPDGITDFSISGQTFQMRMPVITEEESPKAIGPIFCRAAQLSLILSDPSNAINVAVRYVAIKAGVTLSYADTEAGYPGADVNADGAQLPATTAGLDNPTGKAIVSGVAEFEITGGELGLLDGTTESVLKLATLVAAGDVIITDQGECVVASVVNSTVDTLSSLDPFGDTSCKYFFMFRDTDRSGSQYKELVNDVYWADFNSYGTTSVSSGWKDQTFSGVGGPQGNTPDIVGFPYAVSFHAQFTGASPWLGAGSLLGFQGSVSAGGLSLDDTQKAAFDFTQGVWTHFVANIYGDHVDIYQDVNKILTVTGATSVGSGSLLIRSRTDGYIDQLRMFNRDLTLEEIQALKIEQKIASSATLETPLSGVPTKAIKQPDVALKVGVGAIGEYIGPKKALPLSSSVPSSTIEVNVESNESLKDKILKTGALHNTLLFDGVEKEVSAVNESTGPVEEEHKNTAGGSTSVVYNISVDRLNPIPTNTVITAVGAKAVTGADTAIGVMRKDADLAYTVMAKGAFHTQVAEDYEWQNLDYTIPDDGYEYYLAMFRHVGSVYYDSITDSYAYLTTADSADSAVGTSLTGFASGPISVAMGYKSSATSYLTTITPAVELPKVPVSVAIPDRFTTPLAIEACVFSGNALKYTCAKVPFSDPNIKRLSLSFSGNSSLRVKAAKIYTEEGA